MTPAANVLPMTRSIQLDFNGLPHNHMAAKAVVEKRLLELVNSLPESVYHLGPDDAEWVTSQLLLAYLHALETGR